MVRSRRDGRPTKEPLRLRCGLGMQLLIEQPLMHLNVPLQSQGGLNGVRSATLLFSGRLALYAQLLLP